MRAWLSVVVLVAACGGPNGTGDDDDPPDAAIDTPDGSTQPGWVTLIERGWQLGPSTEAFKCIRVKIPQDMFITGFRVKSPPGTHHELLTISTAGTPIGQYECDATNTDVQMLYAGGIQTDPLVFPAGVGIKLPANTYINLNLHVANFTDTAMSCNPPGCSSGIEVQTAPAANIQHEAEAIFLGTFDIHIPATTNGWVEQGGCQVPAQWNLLNLWPHMHGYAKHQRVSVTRASNGTTDTLLDTSYSYMDQKNYPMTNVALQINDQLKVECTYDNPTPGEIQYGDSAIQEMCFAGFYKWPTNNLNKYFCSMN